MRDYGTANWKGGNSNCEHIEEKCLSSRKNTLREGKGDHTRTTISKQYKSVCKKCGAVREDLQIGLEQHPKEWIAKMVEVSRELKRVLKPAGSYWLNVGDTYFGGKGKSSFETEKELNERQKDSGTLTKQYQALKFDRPSDVAKQDGGWLQPKQKMLMPHRLAIALQEDGWILRNDIVWHKPSHMPSSVRDRLTNSFEFVFHFVKQRKYFYDLDAIRELHKEGSLQRYSLAKKQKEDNSVKNLAMHEQNPTYRTPMKMNAGMNPNIGKNPGDAWKADYHSKAEPYLQNNPHRVRQFGQVEAGHESGKNPGDAWKLKKWANMSQAQVREGHDKDVCGRIGLKNPGDFWAINPKPYPEAHFACFPPALVEKPLKATCPKQVCVKCGKPRERITETDRTTAIKDDKPRINAFHKRSLYANIIGATKKTVGFSDCGCNAGFKPGIVLDPFVGSGTTLFVAQRLGLRGIGVELNPDYIPLIKKRLLGDANQTSLNPNKVEVICSSAEQGQSG